MGRPGGASASPTSSRTGSFAPDAAALARPQGPRLLRPLQPGGAEHAARRAAAQGDARGLARRRRASRARSCSPSRRATRSPTRSSSGSTRPSSRRSTARTSTASRPSSTTSSTTSRRPPTSWASTGSRRRWSSRWRWPTCSSSRCEQLADALEHLRGFKDLEQYWIEIHRLENEGDRLYRDAVASLFANGIDPMFVIRWRDIFSGSSGRSTPPRPRPTSSKASSSRTRRRSAWRERGRPDPRASSSRRRSRSTSPTASTTPPTSSRPRSRPGRCRRGSRSRYAAILNFAGAFISLEVAATVAKDVVDPARDHDHGDLRRAGRRDRLEPDHLVLRPAVVELSHALIGGVVGSTFAAAGADAIFGEGILGKVLIPAVIAPIARLRRRRDRDRRLLPDRRPAAAGAGDPRLPPRAGRSPAGCSRSPTAPTTRRRRWA